MSLCPLLINSFKFDNFMPQRNVLALSRKAGNFFASGLKVEIFVGFNINGAPKNLTIGLLCNCMHT